MEVRCSVDWCIPRVRDCRSIYKKNDLLGWIDIKDNGADSYRFFIESPDNYSSVYEEMLPIRELVLEIVRFYEEGKGVFRVFKADQPIELLRRVPGFKENLGLRKPELLRY